MSRKDRNFKLPVCISCKLSLKALNRASSYVSLVFSWKFIKSTASVHQTPFEPYSFNAAISSFTLDGPAFVSEAIYLSDDSSRQLEEDEHKKTSIIFLSLFI